MDLVRVGLDIVTAIGLAGLWVFVWLRRPPFPYWPHLSTVLVAGLLYVSGDLLTAMPRSLVAESVGITSLYAGVHLASWGWLALATGFLQSSLLVAPFRRALLTGFASASALVVIAVATNPWHGVILTPVLGGRNEYHAAWVVHAGVAALEMFLALALLLVTATRDRHEHDRGSAWLLLLIGTAVAAGSATYALSPTDLGFDPVVPLILAGHLTMVFGIYRLQIFNLLPDTLPEIVDRTLEAIVLGDGHGRIVYANQSARSLLGPDLDVGARPALFDLLSQSFEDETGELSADLIREALLRAASEHASMTVKTRTNPPRILAMRIHEVPWGRSNLAMAAELQDITEQHEQRQRVRLSERRLRRLIRTVPVGILSCDHRGHIDDANPRLAAILGAPNENEIIGVDIFEGTSDSAKQLHDLFRRTLQHGESTFGQEVEHTTRWGRQIFIRVSVEPLRDSRDQITGALATIEDVTLAKQLEGERSQLEKRMFDAQRLQSLGMVSGAIAHDFNNLLTIIKGHVELGLLKASDDDELRVHLQQISLSTDHGAELADQIMAYAGQAPTSMHPMDCSVVAAEMETLLEAVIGKRVPFELDLAPELPMVLGDRGQIRQVLVNLLLNASHAQQGRKGSVRLRTDLTDFSARSVTNLVVGYELPVGQYVSIEVSDDGVGMDRRTRKRVFDPFFTTREDGRGLGLAATLGIVRAHGAALSLDSEPEKGTTFRIFFPVLHAQQEANQSIGDAEPGERKEGAAQES